MKSIFMTVLGVLLASCAGLKRQSPGLSMTSSPAGAEVSYLSKHNKFEKLGLTPLNLKDGQLQRLQSANDQFLALQVRKSGHAVETILVDLRSTKKISYFAALEPIDVWNNKEQEISSVAANSLARKIQLINQLVMRKNHQAALSRADLLINQFPKAGAFYDIKGSIFLLMGDRPEAIANYRKSLQLNPENADTQRMLEKLNGGVQ
jgi:tetratricopeptide (TPR) repeat protein